MGGGTTQYEEYLAAVGTKRKNILEGDTIALGAGVSLTCVAVNGNGQLSPPFSYGQYDENDLCVALKLTFHQFDFFIAGDLSGRTASGYHDIETSVAPEVGKVEVYRVNHHGSKNGTNEYFLNTLHPKVSLISVGKNPYGQPDTSVVTRLRALPCDIYCTQDSAGNGDITVKVYDDGFSVNGAIYACWRHVRAPCGVLDNSW